MTLGPSYKLLNNYMAFCPNYMAFCPSYILPKIKSKDKARSTRRC